MITKLGRCAGGRWALRASYCCRLSENFHCCDRAGPHTSTLRPPLLAVRLSRHRLLPTCRNLELPSICSHFCNREGTVWGRSLGQCRVCWLLLGMHLLFPPSFSLLLSPRCLHAACFMCHSLSTCYHHDAPPNARTLDLLQPTSPLIHSARHRGLRGSSSLRRPDPVV